MARGARDAVAASLTLLALLPGAPARAAGPPQARPAPAQPEAELLLVAVSINGALRDGEYVVARRGGTFLVRIADLDRWRLRHRDAAAETIEGEAYLPLDALYGVTAQWNAAAQQLDLGAPPEAFVAQQRAAARAGMRPTDGTFAAFVNYDAALEYRAGLRGGALIEAGMSDDWGLVAGTLALGRDTGARDVTRLDTYYLRDFPDRLLRLSIGDAITDAPDWLRPVRFGGIHLGTDFGLQPDLVTFPVPEFAGRAAVPSSVELLVNDAVRYQGSVDQGPFSIGHVPLVTGAGDVTLVVRDPLGVERRVRTSYYVSPRLLRRGLAAWSFEAGAERRDYGIESFAYRNPFLAGSYRHGLTDWLTVEGRAEASRDARMAGAGVDFVWPALGEFAIAGAASQSDAGTGTLYRVSFARVTPRWNVALRYQRGSRRFSQLGIDRDTDRIAELFQASAGLSLGRWGSLTASRTLLGYAAGARTRLISADYSVSVGNRAYLSLFALHSRAAGGVGRLLAGAGLTMPLGQHGSAYAQADNRNVLGEVQRVAPVAGGWGYRLTASAGETERQQLALSWRGDIGQASIEAARTQGDSAVRAIASGSLLLAGGTLHAARRIDGGIGVVEVPGQANVRIYQENQLIARTDAQGRAILPELRAYDANRLSLAPSDVPLDAGLSDDRLIVVPRYRGAAIARFAVRHDRPATILVALPDGTPVPAGADARADSGEAAFVGYGGAIFLRDARPGMAVTVDSDAGPCRAVLPARLPETALPQIGPLRCTMEAPAP